MRLLKLISNFVSSIHNRDLPAPRAFYAWFWQPRIIYKHCILHASLILEIFHAFSPHVSYTSWWAKSLCYSFYNVMRAFKTRDDIKISHQLVYFPSSQFSQFQARSVKGPRNLFHIYCVMAAAQVFRLFPLPSQKYYRKHNQKTRMWNWNVYSI